MHRRRYGFQDSIVLKTTNAHGHGWSSHGHGHSYGHGHGHGHLFFSNLITLQDTMFSLLDFTTASIKPMHVMHMEDAKPATTAATTKATTPATTTTAANG
jgi:hypothetical protein